MASQPDRDPIEDEAERVLAENPGLHEELEAFGRAYDAGQVPPDELVPHETVRRRLGKILEGAQPEGNDRNDDPPARCD